MTPAELAWQKRLPRTYKLPMAPISPDMRPERPFNRKIHAEVVKKRLINGIHRASRVLSIKHIFPRGQAPKIPARSGIAGAIVDMVCEATGQTREEIKSKRRSAALVEARFCCYFLLYKHTTMSLPEIGNFLGGKDHTSVLNGRDKVTANPHLFEHITKPVEAALGVL